MAKNCAKSSLKTFPRAESRAVQHIRRRFLLNNEATIISGLGD